VQWENDRHATYIFARGWQPAIRRQAGTAPILCSDCAGAADLVHLAMRFPLLTNESDSPSMEVDDPERAPIAYPLLFLNVLTHVVAAMYAGLVQGATPRLRAFPPQGKWSINRRTAYPCPAKYRSTVCSHQISWPRLRISCVPVVSFRCRWSRFISKKSVSLLGGFSRDLWLSKGRTDSLVVIPISYTDLTLILHR
jgi:hypothetical protein